MDTSTNTTHTASMPRITDMKWGKYAKKDSGTNTPTTVLTNGTTVTTSAQKVTINFVNGQPPQKPGKVIYKGRTFDIPKNIWGSPYPFAGMGGMNFDAMPSIWGSGFGGGCSGSGHKLDNWDRFYQFANGPISGQVFGAAALGGLGGLAMGIGKALSGDDKKADKSDDSSKIKDYYNGTSSSSSTSSEFSKISGHDDISEVSQYNDYTSEVSQADSDYQLAVKAYDDNERNISEQAPITEQAQKDYETCTNRISEIEKRYGNLDNDLQKIKDIESKKPEERTEEEKVLLEKKSELEKIKQELDDLKGKVDGLKTKASEETDKLKNLVTGTNGRTELNDKKQAAYKAQVEKHRIAREKKRAAEKAIRGKSSDSTAAATSTDVKKLTEWTA